MSSKPEFTPTDEQVAVRDAARARSGSVMVEAGAGCAKTSTLKLVASEVRQPALALAFGKRNAEDLRKALPSVFEVKTMNGLGFGAWARTLPPGAVVKLDDRKVGRLVSDVAREWKMELNEDQWTGTRQLVQQAMLAGLVPSGDACDHQSLVPDTEDGWKSVALSTDLSIGDTLYCWEAAREVLRRDIALARQGLISFDDQIYCSVMLGGKFPRFPWVFVDEDQDLSMLQIRMLGMVFRERVMAVGDKHQAIYAWRGAMGDSAERIRALAPPDSWTDLPLLTTFRCPKLVVARQQEHVPGYTAWHTNPYGAVQQLGVAPEGSFEQVWSWESFLALRAPGSIAVLCRNNGPLLSFAVKLLRKQIGCHMLGRDIGKGLQALLRKLVPDTANREATAAAIYQWRDRESALALANDMRSKVEQVQDKADCLLAVLESAECADAGQLQRTLATIFAQQEGLVTLSSIHRAKGLEFDNVLVLDPWRTPVKWAREAAKSGTPAGLLALEQEHNARYVAETRTRFLLAFGNLDEWVAD